MIAIDTSSLSAYLSGEAGEDVELVERSVAAWHAVLPPVALTEILSSPRLAPAHAAVLRSIPLLDVTPGYWERAGALRARILATRHKARLADCLIAQSCIDQGVQLITRDIDFRRFAAAE